MRAVWLTDIHLNFLSLNDRGSFYGTLRDTGADCIFITGDISEAASVDLYLEKLRNTLHRNQSVYFIAGNHDYYHGSISEVRASLNAVSHGQLTYLTTTEPKQLIDQTFICGVDGWADGRLGNYSSSSVVLNDAYLIEELYISWSSKEFRNEYVELTSKDLLLRKMQELADADAFKLKNKIEQCVKQNASKIIILTHIPPFKEVSLYNNKISDDNYLPFFSSKAIGDVIELFAESYPEIEFLVLCGHSHHAATYKPQKNLEVRCGGAEYYKPQIAGEFVF